MTNRRSKSYIDTVGNYEPALEYVDVVRNTVRKVNDQLKSSGSFDRYRVVLRGRLGKNNPNALLYRRGGKLYRWSSITIRPEHASHFDIYIYKR